MGIRDDKNVVAHTFLLFKIEPQHTSLNPVEIASKKQKTTQFFDF